MITGSRLSYIACLTLLGFLGAAPLCIGQISDRLHIVDSPADKSTAIRFFFNSEDYFHAPLIFRVVDPKDARLNTAPMRLEGRTAYITAPEMQKMMQGLVQFGLTWQESRKRQSFVYAAKNPLLYEMRITVVSSRGTAVSGVDPVKICENLAPLDSTLTTPRALWEFQVFRGGYDCKVPGLSGETYPDHWPH